MMTHARPAPVPATVSGALQKSAARPLAPSVRAAVEPLFCFDFSRVRVHADGAASEAARSMRAGAFTVGDTIAFAPGRYRPETTGGLHLLGHELAHVIQQQRGGHAGEALEAEAERAGDAVVRGSPSPVRGGSPVALALRKDEFGNEIELTHQADAIAGPLTKAAMAHLEKGWFAARQDPPEQAPEHLSAVEAFLSTLREDRLADASANGLDATSLRMQLITARSEVRRLRDEERAAGSIHERYWKRAINAVWLGREALALAAGDMAKTERAYRIDRAAMPSARDWALAILIAVPLGIAVGGAAILIARAGPALARAILMRALVHPALAQLVGETLVAKMIELASAGALGLSPMEVAYLIASFAGGAFARRTSAPTWTVSQGPTTATIPIKPTRPSTTVTPFTPTTPSISTTATPPTRSTWTATADTIKPARGAWVAPSISRPAEKKPTPQPTTDDKTRPSSPPPSHEQAAPTTLREVQVAKPPPAANVAPAATTGPPSSERGTLHGDLTAMLARDPSVAGSGLIDRIHRATLAERQQILSDPAMLALIRSRLENPRHRRTVMSALMVGSYRWDNPPDTTFFQQFTRDGGSTRLPPNASLNCWESILYGAHLAGAVDRAWIRGFYSRVYGTSSRDAAAWGALGFHNGLRRYIPGGAPQPGVQTPRTVQPRPGQLLFYVPKGGLLPTHVALSLGGNQAISLWGMPNNVKYTQRIGVNELPGLVFIGDPPWSSGAHAPGPASGDPAR